MTIAELPGVYLDDVYYNDAADRPRLVNRVPSPEAVDVAYVPNIYLELQDVLLDGIDLAATQVTVNGVLAFDAGSFLNGWSGSYDNLRSEGVIAPDWDGLSISLDPPSGFDSQSVVEVRVQSDLNGGGSPIDETYSFTIEDLTPPDVVSAIAIDQQTIRVTFDEPVRSAGDGDPADALTPGNYEFEAIHDEVTPAVPIVAVSVTAVNGAEFDIGLDIPMTPAVQYKLTISNIEDLEGNPIV